MADETTQTEEETSWWDLDIFADSELPSTSFDEPLEWPDALDWGDFSAADGDLQFPGAGDMGSGPIFPPTSDPEPPAPDTPAPAADTQWRATGDGDDPTMPHITVLSGLGGTASGAQAARAAEHTAHERLPDSLWAGGAGSGVQPAVTKSTAAPTFHAEPDRGGWRRRFDIRHGNAAIIALISFVSLILLGMFMSVRARNQLPDTSQTRTTSDQIQVEGPLNTVPLTTPPSTIPPAINIAELVPPEDATTVTAGSSGGSSPAATAAPARSTPAGGGTGTTQPAAQPTNTTAAPQTTVAPETTTPPVTSPPADQTTTPTSSRRTTPTFPSLTTTVPDNNTSPSFTLPTFPPGFGN